MDWRRVVERFPSRLIAAEGFSVRIYERYGVRYYDGDRELTLMTGLEDATDRYGRTYFILPTIETLIFVPKLVAWDNGEPLTEAESTTVIQRICEAFEKRHIPYQVIVGDKIYEQMAIDGQRAKNHEI